MEKKSVSIDPVLVRQLLLESSCSLDFLKKYFDLRVKVLGRPGYSTFSQRAGFSSRSHVRDMLNGRVAITDASMVKIAKALGFKNEVADFFFLKDKVENQEKGTQGKGKESFNQIIQFLKQKIEIDVQPENHTQLPVMYKGRTSIDKHRYDEFKGALNDLLSNFDSNKGNPENKKDLDLVCEISLTLDM